MSGDAVPTDLTNDRQVRPFFNRLARAVKYVTGEGFADFPELREDGKRVFVQTGNATGGLTITEYDLGTPTNGSTVTPNPSNALKQKLTNNVAGFTIAATSEIGDVELRVTNGASAGTISFSGFDKQWSGDALTTTDTHQFVIFIYGFDGKQAYLVKALQ